jgi:hypothetical protein
LTVAPLRRACTRRPLTVTRVGTIGERSERRRPVRNRIRSERRLRHVREGTTRAAGGAPTRGATLWTTCAAGCGCCGAGGGASLSRRTENERPTGGLTGTVSDDLVVGCDDDLGHAHAEDALAVRREVVAAAVTPVLVVLAAAVERRHQVAVVEHVGPAVGSHGRSERLGALELEDLLARARAE